MFAAAATTRINPAAGCNGSQLIPADAAWPGFLPAGTRLHEYQIARVLGHGGFGITYLARDTHLGKPMAIKEYLPAELAFRSGGAEVSVRSPAEQEAFNWGLRQFLREAQTLARFSHANLVPVYRFFEANQTAYIVMGYAEGEALDSVFRRELGLGEERLRGVLLPVMDGLEAVHRDGVLHRDIKPDNIILRPDGSPVLIDFGAARFNLGAATSTAFCAVSAGYAPLEQYGESSGQGPWTDIYALGALAYRAISGRRPPEAVNRVHDDPLVPAKSIGSGRYSAAMLAAVDWALTMNPEARPRNISELRQALNGGEAGAWQITASVRRTSLLRLQKWVAGSAAAAAVLSVGLVPTAISLRTPPPMESVQAQKNLQMTFVLTAPLSLPESRPKKVKGIPPDLQLAALEEKRPIHRRR